jgi:urease accessory protein
MLKLIDKTTAPGPTQASLTLPLHDRLRCRLKATLDQDGEVGVLLPRGVTLKDGDVLVSEQGERVLVRAAAEPLSVVRVTDPLALARACYHLGNRHVPVQIAADELRYPHDHVLDEMLRGLGLRVEFLEAGFEPEPGAYGGHAGPHHAAREEHRHHH